MVTQVKGITSFLGADVINVKVDGAVGNGSVDDRAALAASDTTATVNGGILYFPQGTYKTSSNLTFSPDVTLWFAPGAKLDPDIGTTITIDGAIQETTHEIFDKTAAGSFIIRAGRLNVKWFGAIGDSTADDTVSITKAIASMLPVQELYFPGTAKDIAGTDHYKVTDEFQLPVLNGLIFSGDGERQSIIRQTGVGKKLFIGSGAATSTNGTVWRGLNMQGGGSFGGVGTTCILLDGTNRSFLQDCRIENWDVGLDFKTVIINRMNNVFIGNNVKGVIHVGSSTPPTSLNWTGCNFNNNDEFGVSLEAVFGLEFSGNDIESNKLGGFILDAVSGGVNISGNYFEQNLTLTGGGEYFDVNIAETSFVDGVTILGNYFNGRTVSETADYIPIGSNFSNGLVIKGNVLNVGNRFIKYGASVTNSLIEYNGFRAAVDTSDLTSLFNIKDGFVNAGNSLHHNNLIAEETSNWVGGTQPLIMSNTVAGGSTAVRSALQYAGQPVVELHRGTGTMVQSLSFTVSATSNRRDEFFTLAVPMVKTVGTPTITLAVDDTSVALGTSNFTPFSEWSVFYVNGYIPAANTTTRLLFTMTVNNSTLLMGKPKLYLGLHKVIGDDNGAPHWVSAVAPIAGTWVAGDIVYDSSPTAGLRSVGFICTTGGTPGTWKTFGDITA